MAWTLCEELHDPQGALKVIDQAVEKSGKQAHILDTRGVIYTRLGKYDAALADLEVAARDLHDPSVYFHLARVYLKKGKADEVRKNRELALKAGLTRERLQEAERADWDAIMNP
jgi:cellulose synthase operon protein C